MNNFFQFGALNLFKRAKIREDRGKHMKISYVISSSLSLSPSKSATFFKLIFDNEYPHNF